MSKWNPTPAWVFKLIQGRCCGRKPIKYEKGTLGFRYLYCTRCSRAFSVETGQQIANWCWKETKPGEFQDTSSRTRVHPQHEGGDHG